MTKIRAFVGHSFSGEDKELVRIFTDHLDNLSKGLPDFSWEHAQPAEPAVVSEKVLKLISDKNVFIAICTKNEQVIKKKQLKFNLFSTKNLINLENDCEWKTSDWIIQEIGLAIGKGLKLILLIENGVRQPGGLQGNVEYIPFDRSSPEKAFDKLLEMFSAVVPEASDRRVADALVKEPTSIDNKDNDDIAWSDIIENPQSGWDRAQFEIAYFHAILRKNKENYGDISESYLATEEADDKDAIASWLAYCEYIRLQYGEGGDLSALKAMSKEHPINSSVSKQLAKGHEKYKDYANAAITYEVAAKNASGDEELQLMGNAVVSYEKCGNSAKSLSVLREMKIKSTHHEECELFVLRTLRNLADFSDDGETEAVVLERMVELDPSNIYLRFSLAYLHSQQGNRKLALFHYLKIPFSERNGVTWNNLGVTFDEFSMPAKSVLAYQKSIEKQETLAMSNLARKYLSMGFIDEGKQLCGDALKISGFSRNIPSTLSALLDVSEEENSTEKKVLEGIQPKGEFYSRYGKAMVEIEPKELSAEWDGPNCKLKVSLVKNEFTAVGSYEIAADNSLLSLSGKVSNTTKKSIQLEYKGKLRGRAVPALVVREVQGGPNTLLGFSGNNSQAMLIISDDGNEISVLEDNRIYKLTAEPPKVQ